MIHNAHQFMQSMYAALALTCVIVKSENCGNYQHINETDKGTGMTVAMHEK